MIALWLALAAGAAVEIETAPSEGAETVLVVTDRAGEPLAGATVRALYRPGLPGEREQAIGITDGRGRIAWTPSASGIARVQAADQRHAVRVAPRGVPEGTAGLLVAVLTLGMLLAGYGSWRPGAR